MAGSSRHSETRASSSLHPLLQADWLFRGSWLTSYACFKMIAKLQILLFICIGISSLAAGKPRLMCPTERVRAKEGESVTLLCHPDQRIDLSEDTVDWTVHVYQCGQDDLDPQSPQYRNRTTLNHEDLKTGNLTLHISSVNQSDNGTYRCVIPEEAKCCIVVLPVDGAKMEAAWIVISTGVVVVAVALVLFILVKCGSIKICKTLEWMKGQEAEKANNGEMENLRTQTERRSSESAV